MEIIKVVSVIFYTEYNYSCSSDKGNILNIEESKVQIKLKDVSKGLDIYGFEFVEYYVRSEIGHMISLCA